MQVTCPELPSRVILGLRCLQFLVGAGLPWQPGGTASAPSLGWAQGAMGMIHVRRDHMSSLRLTLKGWSLWGLA